jgi:hypothetical protein
MATYTSKLQVQTMHEKVLEYLYEHSNSGPLPMNDFLETFDVPNPRVFIPVFRDLEKFKWVKCEGNYAWLGSWHTGELMGLSDPQTKFTCELLPAGKEYMQQKSSAQAPVITITKDKKQETPPPPPPPQSRPAALRRERTSVPWYEHWIFWLVITAVFMAFMIGLVEYKS